MQQAQAAGPTFVSGALNVTWADDSRSLTYSRAGRTHRFELASRSDVEVDVSSRPAAGPFESGPCPRAPVDRGRQSACAASPDRTMKAFYRDRNVFVSRADGSGEIAVTTDGREAARLKYGVASWVYGEELDQVTAIWWSPDGRKVAFYRFDERPVRDYYVTLDQTAVQDSVDVEAYPKAGTDNPIADVLVYDLQSRQTTTLDVRDGRPFSNDVVGHYVFNVHWAPDSSEVRLHRTDRLQQILELSGCSPGTGVCRRIVREEWPTGWVENRPTFRLLDDGRRFVWASDRTGWRNYYLYEVTGRLVNPITTLAGVDAGPVVKIDEAAGVLFYMAGDGDTPLKMQLHRVGLDGTGDRRITDPASSHRVTISPDNRYYVDVAQDHMRPPTTSLVSMDGGLIATLATSDITRFDELKLRPIETFTYLAADGATTLVGAIAFPSTFDPARRYPVLVSVYGGPESASNTPSETFAVPPATTEFGFLVVSLSSRAMPGLGRRTLDSIYRRLGQVEVDDMAEGIKALGRRPYVDGRRVGIYGTSYGGYVAAMMLLRHPDLAAAASASSAVTDWRHYDTIYTERYMGLPRDNADGYERGSLLRYAGGLRGRLLIYFGTADNNVHPSNSLQLVDALTRAGKSFEVQVGPDAEHSSVPLPRMLEFFVENLIQRPERLRLD